MTHRNIHAYLSTCCNIVISKKRLLMDPMDLRKERIESLLIEKAETEEKLKNCKNDWVRVQIANEYEMICEQLKFFRKSE